MTSTVRLSGTGRCTLLLRALAVLALVLGQFGLLVWYGQGVEQIDRSDTVTRGDLLTPGETHVGKTVVVTGTVVSADPVRIAISGTDGTVHLTIVDLAVDVAVGDQLRVRGTMVRPGTVSSAAAFTVPRWELWYVWGISFVAGLWVLFRSLRTWTVDGDRLAIVPRDQGKHGRSRR